MADRVTQPLEGWGVQARPAVIALAVFVVILVAGVTAAAIWYRGDVAPETRPRLTVHPTPALETLESAPSDRPAPPSRPPASIDRAMTATVAKGDALWGNR